MRPLVEREEQMKRERAEATRIAALPETRWVLIKRDIQKAHQAHCETDRRTTYWRADMHTKATIGRAEWSPREFEMVIRSDDLATCEPFLRDYTREQGLGWAVRTGYHLDFIVHDHPTGERVSTPLHHPNVRVVVFNLRD